MAKTLIGNVKGKDGRGIASISKTGTTGSVDTYTIEYTDGTTSTYTVNNSDSVSLQRQIVPSAAVESSATASQAYAAGDYVVVNGVLRKVKSAIAKGNAISDSNSTATTVGGEFADIRASISHQTTMYERNNAPHGSCRLNMSNNMHRFYGTVLVLSNEWDSVWNAAVKCPGISDDKWYIKTDFKVQTPSKAYSVQCSGITIGEFSGSLGPEHFNSSVYCVGTDGYIYIPIGSSKPTTTRLWFFWGRVAEENIV